MPDAAAPPSSPDAQLLMAAASGDVDGVSRALAAGAALALGGLALIAVPGKAGLGAEGPGESTLIAETAFERDRSCGVIGGNEILARSTASVAASRCWRRCCRPAPT